jgi:hypothetical protein
MNMRRRKTTTMDTMNDACTCTYFRIEYHVRDTRLHLNASLLLVFRTLQEINLVLCSLVEDFVNDAKLLGL